MGYYDKYYYLHNHATDSPSKGASTEVAVFPAIRTLEQSISPFDGFIHIRL